MKTRAEKVGLNCVKAASKKWGKGWFRLSAKLKHNAVCAEIVSVLLNQAGNDGVDVKAVACEALAYDPDDV